MDADAEAGYSCNRLLCLVGTVIRAFDAKSHPRTPTRPKGYKEWHRTTEKQQQQQKKRHKVRQENGSTTQEQEVLKFVRFSYNVKPQLQKRKRSKGEKGRQGEKEGEGREKERLGVACLATVVFL